ncbi:MAG: ribosome silencing factor [Chloroflexi bacterium]|nr:ribosome silencing factor [Chloroflexota bacterium]MCI0773860.1 ribosome silencing factor [Chloroflexota bacterium]
MGGTRVVDDSLELAHTMVDVLEEKKGEDILILDLAGVASFTNLFVMCNGRSARTLKALSSEVGSAVKEKHNRLPLQVEGDSKSGWILLDYGEVILHLFSPALRDYYALEELWAAGRVVLRMT